MLGLTRPVFDIPSEREVLRNGSRIPHLDQQINSPDSTTVEYLMHTVNTHKECTAISGQKDRAIVCLEGAQRVRKNRNVHTNRIRIVGPITMSRR